MPLSRLRTLSTARMKATGDTFPPWGSEQDRKDVKLRRTREFDTRWNNGERLREARGGGTTRSLELEVMEVKSSPPGGVEVEVQTIMVE